MRGKSLVLLFALLLQLVLYPLLLDVGIRGPIPLALSVSLGPLAAIYFMASDKKRLVIALALGIPLEVIGLIRAFAPQVAVSSFYAALGLGFYGYAVSAIVADIISLRAINLATISDAASGYLLLGIAWIALYALLEDVRGGSFVHLGGTFDLTYYSFVILTGVGSSTVLPNSALAQSLTILEAVAGVLYVAILVALLVGVYSASVSGRSR